MRTIWNKAGRNRGYLMVEIAVSLCLVGLIVSCLVSGYNQSAHSSEWASYSLAAQAQAIRGLEQARAAKWDRAGSVDELVQTNFSPRVEILDIPMRGDNIVYVTNFITISTVAVTPPLRMIRVDSVWPFLGRGLFTNSAFTYRAPDQ